MIRSERLNAHKSRIIIAVIIKRRRAKEVIKAKGSCCPWRNPNPTGSRRRAQLELTGSFSSREGFAARPGSAVIPRSVVTSSGSRRRDDTPQERLYLPRRKKWTRRAGGESRRRLLLFLSFFLSLLLFYIITPTCFLIKSRRKLWRDYYLSQCLKEARTRERSSMLVGNTHIILLAICDIPRLLVRLILNMSGREAGK